MADKKHISEAHGPIFLSKDLLRIKNFLFVITHKKKMTYRNQETYTINFVE